MPSEDLRRVRGTPHGTRNSELSLASTSYAQGYCYGYSCNNRTGWRGSYTAAVVIVNRRRRYARAQNPTVKPPIFGTAPPGYSLPLWTGNRAPAPAYDTPTEARNNNINDATGNDNTGTNSGVGGMTRPPPASAAHAPSDPPPPSYGNVVDGVDNDNGYSPLTRLGCQPQGPRPPTNTVNQGGGSYAPPIGPPPQAHTAGETSHFVGGFRQAQ
ncbi:hypothetical protein FIBSPDRAFT_895183 [Athelia psychrophila]|uniref:Uncharacterized protein n=1 Tax=Athelia psychrophila TaxID=1759441 RepID=A0A166F060_9AGAM|nr:hypothetical protein FIBSPDRAFT_895183 [Fibularhizoctonia sp. CBS 109695]